MFTKIKNKSLLQNPDVARLSLVINVILSLILLNFYFSSVTKKHDVVNIELKQIEPIEEVRVLPHPAMTTTPCLNTASWSQIPQTYSLKLTPLDKEGVSEKMQEQMRLFGLDLQRALPNFPERLILQDGDGVLDFGANIGEFSRNIRKKCKGKLTSCKKKSRIQIFSRFFWRYSNRPSLTLLCKNRLQHCGFRMRTAICSKNSIAWIRSDSRLFRWFI